MRADIKAGVPKERSVTVSGFVADEPRKYCGKDADCKKMEVWSFKLCETKNCPYADGKKETVGSKYLKTGFWVVKADKATGKRTSDVSRLKVGSPFSSSGVFSPGRSDYKGGILGSFEIPN